MRYNLQDAAYRLQVTRLQVKSHELKVATRAAEEEETREEETNTQAEEESAARHQTHEVAISSAFDASMVFMILLRKKFRLRNNFKTIDRSKRKHLDFPEFILVLLDST